MSKEAYIDELVAKVGIIAELLSKNKDVEIRTSRDGITVIEVSKKVIR